jgi:hypothetical protein
MVILVLFSSLNNNELRLLNILLLGGGRWRPVGIEYSMWRLIPEKFMTGRLSQMLMPCSTLWLLKGYWHFVVFDIKGIIMETIEVPIIT